MTIGEIAIVIALALNAVAVLLGTRNLTRKVDVIHGLVNSNMTAAMQSEHEAVIRELAMMREVVGLRLAAGHEPTVETLATIKATEIKLMELKAALADRGA